MECRHARAQDGLLPDGREGAIVVRRDRQRGKVANWQPMIAAGIRKKGAEQRRDRDMGCARRLRRRSASAQLGDNPQVASQL